MRVKGGWLLLLHRLEGSRLIDPIPGVTDGPRPEGNITKKRLPRVANDRHFHAARE